MPAGSATSAATWWTAAYNRIMATPTRIRPETLLEMEDGDRYELVDGALVERNVSNESSHLGARVSGKLMQHADEHRAGLVFGADCGLQVFAWDEDMVRFADASFLARARVPSGVPGPGHLRVIPDLVVEVVSPNDIASDLERKLRDYLRAGARLIWVVYPESRTVRIERQSGVASRLGAGDTLTGEDVLPGFELPVDALFGS